jgi:hypothetical protein
MGGSEGASSAPAHEAGGRSQTEARRLQEGNVRSLGQTRFEPISTRTGASPSFLRRLQRQSVSSLSFGSPFSRRNGRFVGAHRRAAIQRSSEHNTNIGLLSRQFASPSHVRPYLGAALSPHIQFASVKRTRPSGGSFPPGANAPEEGLSSPAQRSRGGKGDHAMRPSGRDARLSTG